MRRWRLHGLTRADVLVVLTLGVFLVAVSAFLPGQYQLLEAGYVAGVIGDGQGAQQLLEKPAGFIRRQVLDEFEVQVGARTVEKGVLKIFEAFGGNSVFVHETPPWGDRVGPA